MKYPLVYSKLTKEILWGEEVLGSEHPGLDEQVGLSFDPTKWIVKMFNNPEDRIKHRELITKPLPTNITELKKIANNHKIVMKDSSNKIKIEKDLKDYIETSNYPD